MTIKTMFEVAMNFLSEGSCSERQLLNHLAKQFAKELELESNLKITMGRLHQLGLINDNRIASNVAERFSHKGNQFITDLLRQQGIDETLIDATLNEMDNEFLRALTEAKNRIQHCDEASIEEAETIIMRFLSGRHFSFKTVKWVIHTMLKEGLFEKFSSGAVCWRKKMNLLERLGHTKLKYNHSNFL